ncbi:MAG: DUF2946 family protein [Caulobacterales bacterium]|jgi:hypothetical protein
MPPVRAAKHDRRAIAALLAVFALMVQALIPAAAMAAQPGPAGALVICTASGAHAVAPDGGPAPPAHRGFGGMPCQDCLAAAMAVVAASPVMAIEPVAYQTARVDHAPVVRLLAPRARAPPRPPGQGPPTA